MSDERLTNEELIREIESIEERLRQLRVSLETRRTQTASHRTRFNVGDKVRVLNPNFAQDSKGTVVKVNQKTGYVTVEGDKRRFPKIVRKEKNLEHIEEL